MNTQNCNEKSILDYALCTKNLASSIKKVVIDEQEKCKISGKNKSDHNTLIIDITKSLRKFKTKPRLTWRINNKTNWEIYKETINNKLTHKNELFAWTD